MWIWVWSVLILITCRLTGAIEQQKAGSVRSSGSECRYSDFATDSNSITIKDFDVDLGLVALDVDDFYLNWKNSKAQGQG
jgi:hypothetical protein